MVAAKHLITESEFAEVDTPGRHDLVDGVLWSMPPAKIPHGRYVARVIASLGQYTTMHRLGEVLSGELGFVLEIDRRTILCPDAAFVRSERVPDASETGFFQGPPDLAVEVISDSERPQQVQTKVARYLSAGATVVWCIYPELQQVVVYHQDDPPRILSTSDSLTAEPLIPGFALPLSELFR